MHAPIELFSALVGLGVIAVAGPWLIGPSDLALTGLFPARGRSDWPQGVQEGDVPHFALDHVDRIRPSVPVDVPTIRELDDVEPAVPTVEPVELHVHRQDPHR